MDVDGQRLAAIEAELARLNFVPDGAGFRVRAVLLQSTDAPRGRRAEHAASLRWLAYEAVHHRYLNTRNRAQSGNEKPRTTMATSPKTDRTVISGGRWKCISCSRRKRLHTSGFHRYACHFGNGCNGRDKVGVPL